MKITGATYSYTKTINGKYRMVIERAASTTKDRCVLGYKVEANSDNLEELAKDITNLKEEAEQLANHPDVEVILDEMY